MKQLLSFSFIAFAFTLVFTSCEADKIETVTYHYTPEQYDILTASLDLPTTPFDYFGQSNADAIGTLGRVLFYDKKLSLDNTVSCGSCHQQQLAFADDVAFSTGIMNRTTARNSLSLGAFRSFSEYSGNPETTLFWDGRVNSLEDQMIQTIRNPNEMGMELSDIVDRINQVDYYKVLSEKAFQQENLTEDQILFALESFMNSILSSASKFDRSVQTGIPHGSNIVRPTFTGKEREGEQLFFENCTHCHSRTVNFFSFQNEIIHNANNGLDLVYTDNGAGEHDPSPEAQAIFKVPGLKNIELTAPYMHDGRFNTLEEVIQFYSDDIQDHPNLHPFLKDNGQPRKFNFTEGQVTALVAFLKTMTDTEMTQEPRWSDPFK